MPTNQHAVLFDGLAPVFLRQEALLVNVEVQLCLTYILLLLFQKRIHGVRLTHIDHTAFLTVGCGQRLRYAGSIDDAQTPGLHIPVSAIHLHRQLVPK